MQAFAKKKSAKLKPDDDVFSADHRGCQMNFLPRSRHHPSHRSIAQLQAASPQTFYN
jgi:hypothetical protein